METLRVIQSRPMMLVTLLLAQRASGFAFLTGKKGEDSVPVVFNSFKTLQTKLCEFRALEGTVEDCSCSFEDVDDATAQYFGPLLLELTQRKFFKYFKVDLDGQCAFWPDDGQCDRFECAVDQECTELPEVWRLEDQLRDEWLQTQQAEEPFLCDSNIPVDRSDKDIGRWSETGGDEVWIEQNEKDMVYVDLLLNPEKFTGYDGEKAQRIWRAIHEENCFQPPRPKEFVLEAFRRFGVNDDLGSAGSGQCLERRVYYRLMSGLQASISTHIAKSDFSPYDVIFKFTKPKDRLQIAIGVLVDRAVFGSKIVKNDPVFVARVGSYPERIHNLYFTYLFVLRAVAKAKDYLVAYDYDTGDFEDDQRTRQLVTALVNNTGWDSTDKDAVTAAAFLADVLDKNMTTIENNDTNDESLGLCVAAARQAFDESALFRVPTTPGMSPLEKALARESVEELRAEFLTRFRNISRIMDCVTCERCRLWGKLQVLGLGTALKILLMQGDESGIGTLQRNEVVALVNTLAQLAKSVDSIKDWQRRAKIRAIAVALVYMIGAALQIILLQLILKRLFPSKRRS